MNDKKKRIFAFLAGCFGALLPLGVVYLVGLLLNNGDEALLVLLSVIPLAVLSLVLWIIVRLKNKPLSLGILLGGITPFLVVFIMTGGCGMLPIS